MAKLSELIQCYVECSDKHRIVKDIDAAAVHLISIQTLHLVFL